MVKRNLRRNYLTIVLDVFYTRKEKIYPDYVL